MFKMLLLNIQTLKNKTMKKLIENFENTLILFGLGFILFVGFHFLKFLIQNQGIFSL